jgi:hypothetical protein
MIPFLILIAIALWIAFFGKDKPDYLFDKEKPSK